MDSAKRYTATHCFRINRMVNTSAWIIFRAFKTWLNEEKKPQTFERKYEEKGIEESHVGWWKKQAMFSRHITNKSNYKLVVNYRHFFIKAYTHSIHSHFSEVRGKVLPPKMQREFIQLITQQVASRIVAKDLWIFFTHISGGRSTLFRWVK